ncbi:MAG: hypothetical protein FWD93_00250 [Coriobacteriia bacterium]|nr:hypothetical protein [Coriobacteriia bacterium]
MSDSGKPKKEALENGTQQMYERELRDIRMSAKQNSSVIASCVDINNSRSGNFKPIWLQHEQNAQ